MEMEKLVSLCKRRGFLFQSSEIYGGITGFWDYGPLGVELKRNVKDAWWRDMVTGHDDLGQHIAMSQMHMPGMAGQRAGDPRQCQGTALVDWVVKDADGNEKGRGQNVMQFAPDGRIAAVTGFWLP